MSAEESRSFYYFFDDNFPQGEGEAVYEYYSQCSGEHLMNV